MTDDPELDFDADWKAAVERSLVDPEYAAFLKAQIDAEGDQELACGDCGTVLLQHADEVYYCPQCGD